MVTQTIALGREYDHVRDDTDESVVGTSLHQGAITSLYTSLVLCGPRRGLPWFIGNQIKIVIPREGNKASYQPYPDILVHPTLTKCLAQLTCPGIGWSAGVRHRGCQPGHRH